MTRQDVPKLTGTPRRPRRAEPPAPNRPCRPRRVSLSVALSSKIAVWPRVCHPGFSSSASVQHARSCDHDGRRSARFLSLSLFTALFFFFSDARLVSARDLRRDLILPPHLPPHTEKTYRIHIRAEEERLITCSGRTWRGSTASRRTARTRACSTRAGDVRARAAKVPLGADAAQNRAARVGGRDRDDVLKDRRADGASTPGSDASETEHASPRRAGGMGGGSDDTGVGVDAVDARLDADGSTSNSRGGVAEESTRRFDDSKRALECASRRKGLTGRARRKQRSARGVSASATRAAPASRSARRTSRLRRERRP